MPYLILNADEILGGEDIYPSDDDILLETSDCGHFRVLKDGRRIIPKLRELSKNLGYDIVLHSINGKKDLEIMLRNLHAASTRHGLDFPKIKTICFFDPTFDANSPDITSSEGVLMIPWGGHSLISQQTLEAPLGITEDNRHEHIVIETNQVYFEAAMSEGYGGYLLGKEARFEDLLEEIAEKVRQQRKKMPICPHPSPASSIFSKTPSTLSFANISTMATVSTTPNNLTEQQQEQEQITIMMTRLEKMIQSCWPYPHKMRKSTKVEALQHFRDLCASMKVSAAVEKIEKDYADVCQGEVGELIRTFSSIRAFEV